MCLYKVFLSSITCFPSSEILNTRVILATQLNCLFICSKNLNWAWAKSKIHMVLLIGLKISVQMLAYKTSCKTSKQMNFKWNRDFYYAYSRLSIPAILYFICSFLLKENSNPESFNINFVNKDNLTKICILFL